MNIHPLFDHPDFTMKVAHCAAVVAVPAFGVSVLSYLPVVQMTAGLLAICSSIFAIAVYIRALRK